jgi:iron-sulfur cluster assembly protein
MINVTENASRHLAEVLSEHTASGQDSSLGLRLWVEKGGCSGMSYAMQMAAAQPGDVAVDAGMATVYVAADSVEFLRGVTLDYVDGLTGSGFKIINPNAARHCGCGTSFEPATQSAA